MIFRSTTLAALTFCAASALPARAEPFGYERVISTVTLSFGDDGSTDRAVLVDNFDAGADLYIFRAIEDAKRMQRIDDLFNILKSKRELWKTTHPNKEFPAVVVLQVDQDVQAIVVKSVFQTAAFAGFPNVSFMVNNLPKSHN